MRKSSYTKWKAKYGGREVSDLRRLREPDEENRRLKQMYAELSPEHQPLTRLILLASEATDASHL